MSRSKLREATRRRCLATQATPTDRRERNHQTGRYVDVDDHSAVCILPFKECSPVAAATTTTTAAAFLLYILLATNPSLPLPSPKLAAASEYPLFLYTFNDEKE